MGKALKLGVRTPDPNLGVNLLSKARSIHPPEEGVTRVLATPLRCQDAYKRTQVTGLWQQCNVIGTIIIILMGVVSITQSLPTASPITSPLGLVTTAAMQAWGINFALLYLF